MPKEATGQARFPYSAEQARENLVQSISVATDLHLDRSAQTENGYSLDVHADKGRYSNKGESISIWIDRLGAAETLVRVSSRLEASLQLADWGKNQANVERVLSFVKAPISAEIENETRNHDKPQRPKEILPCRYCGGYPYLQKSSSGMLFVYADRIEYHIVKKQFAIPLQDIISAELFTTEQLSQRFTATRLLALGFLAFAAPKKERNESSVVTVTYRLGGMENKLFLRADEKSRTDPSIRLHAAILRAKVESNAVQE